MTIRNGSESLTSRLLSPLLFLQLLLLLPALSAAPASSQEAIDLEAARSIFAEAEAVAGAGSELWGVELYGPMLFVDRGTRAVVANVADAEGNLAEREGVFTGTLPVDVGIANTGVDWAGRRWTMLVWPLPAGVWQRRVLLVHEMYHRVQPELGMSFPEGSNAHLDTAEGRTWLRLEWRALREALGATGEARRTAVRDALAFRARRRSLFPGGVEGERRLELNEGLAEYTGIRVAIAPDARHGWAARQLDEHEGLALSRSVVRSFAYASGPAYGLLLDATDSDWRAEATDSTDLGSLLDGRIGGAGGGVRASVYGSERVAAEEAERERVRVAQQESFRQQFEVGPTLTLPVGEGFGYSFNPNAVTPFGDAGSVYETAAVRGPWGRLQVTSGGVLLLQGAGGIQGVVVPAPPDPSGSPLSGDGWTLELNEGWELEPGEREGDLVVRPDVDNGRAPVPAGVLPFR